jgi:hypothetical protein
MIPAARGPRRIGRIGARFGHEKNILRDSILAGAGYFACVFAAGFVAGTIRVLFVMPAIGDLAEMLMELPIMRV